MNNYEKRKIIKEKIEKLNKQLEQLAVHHIEYQELGMI